MKRRWFLMFMCLALFLSACGPIHEENATQTSESDVPEVQPFSQLPLEHGNDMVEYDPEREIYIACQNQYKDLYTDLAGHGISFMILSKQQLDPEKIQVILPIETEYLYSIGEEKVQLKTREEIDTYFPKHIFYCYAGFDYSTYKAMLAEYLEDEYLSTEESAALAEFEAPYLDAYNALTIEELPVFYCYSGSIWFIDKETMQTCTIKTTETFTSMDVIIDGVTYHEELGEIKLIPENLLSYSSSNGDYALIGENGGYGGMGGILWDQNPALEYMNTYTCVKDVTITGFRVPTNNCDIVEIQVQHTSGGQTVEYSWDGKTPIYAYEGDTLSIWVEISNPNIGKFWQGMIFCFVLDYEVEGRENFVCISFDYTTEGWNYTELYERYAIVFDGVDLRQYYGD